VRQSVYEVRCELGAMRTGRTVEDYLDKPALCCCHNKFEMDRALVVDTFAVTSSIIVSHVEGLLLWQLDTA
jgi:hypothetical protein